MDIIVAGYDNSVFFYVQEYVGKYLDSHYCSYVIQNASTHFCVSWYDLADHHPLIFHRSFNLSDENLCISLLIIIQQL